MSTRSGPFSGHSHSEQTKAIIAQKMRERPRPASFSYEGRKHSEATRAKMSAAAQRRAQAKRDAATATPPAPPQQET